MTGDLAIDVWGWVIRLLLAISAMGIAAGVGLGFAGWVKTSRWVLVVAAFAFGLGCAAMVLAPGKATASVSYREWLQRVPPIQPLNGFLIDTRGNLLLDAELEALVANAHADTEDPDAIGRLSHRCRVSYEETPPGWDLVCVADDRLYRRATGRRIDDE